MTGIPGMELDMDLPAAASSSDEPTLSPSATAATQMATPSAATAAESTSAAATAQSQAPPAIVSGLQPPLTQWTQATGAASAPWTSTTQRPDAGGELNQASISVLIRNTFAAAQAAAVAAAAPGRRPEWSQTTSLGLSQYNFNYAPLVPPQTLFANMAHPDHGASAVHHGSILDQHLPGDHYQQRPDFTSISPSHSGMSALPPGQAFDGLGTRVPGSTGTLFNPQAQADGHVLSEGLSSYPPLSPAASAHSVSNMMHYQQMQQLQQQQQLLQQQQQLLQQQQQQQRLAGLAADSAEDLMVKSGDYMARPEEHRSSASSTPVPANGDAQVGVAAGGRPKTNKCHICRKQYARPSTLKTHMRTHTHEKPYTCELCAKKFSQAANLNAHMRTHTGDKPFSCEICHRTFSQSSSVTTHRRTHSGEKPYTCSICQKKFADTSTLTKHTRTHTGDKPYKCQKCGHAFTQSGNLNRHMKTHKKKV